MNGWGQEAGEEVEIVGTLVGDGTQCVKGLLGSLSRWCGTGRVVGVTEVGWHFGAWPEIILAREANRALGYDVHFVHTQCDIICVRGVGRLGVRRARQVSCRSRCLREQARPTGRDVSY